MIPQAFTTRDMSEAYKWLQSLPPHLREEMKSMEQVVSLYLRAKRLGGTLPSKEELQNFRIPETKTSQDFHKSLKTLKVELDQFDLAASPSPATLASGFAPSHGENVFGNHQNAGSPTTTNHSSISASGIGGSGSGNGGASGNAMSQNPAGSQNYSAQTAAHGQNTGAAGTQSAHSHGSSTLFGHEPEHHVVNPLSAMRMDPKSRQILQEIREGFNLSSDTEVIRMCLILAHKTLKPLITRDL